ncbi:helix-turn-helix domain-containing protein [Streptomyces sp. NPDC001848]|uniref:helix-turn-helix domain-containing protein n=1 Tax=Streptomyces sp. NPDC001848 TaxID=3364618 RepID=UPI003673B39E
MSVVEQRYRAVLAVLAGASVTEVAASLGVSRQTVSGWESRYLAYWLKEVVEPNLRPLTAATYETTVRLYIVPFLGAKRLDRLTVQDMRSWLNKLAETCQCRAQGKDAKRPEEKQRCCAKGECCRQTPSKRSVNDARTILRSALTNAMVEERISKNVAQLVKVQRARRKRPDPWSVEEACSFLENAQTWRDTCTPLTC